MGVDTGLHTAGDPLDREGERPFTSVVEHAGQGSDGVSGVFSRGRVLKVDPQDASTVVPQAVGEKAALAEPAFTVAAGNNANFVISVTSPAVGKTIEASVFKDKSTGEAGDLVKKVDWVRVAPVAEVQTTAFTDIGVGDTFTLTFSGQTTGAIAYQATAATVLAALEALSNIAPGDVAVVKNSDTEYVFTFDTELGDVPLLVCTPTGFAVTTITETTKGVSALVFKPADGIVAGAKYVVVCREISGGEVGLPGPGVNITAPAAA